MKLRIAMSSLAAVFFSTAIVAEGVSIDPGQWEMTSTLTMTMMPHPQTTKIMQCIEETELSPDSFNMDKDNPCDVTEVAVDGNTARWSINCPIDGGPAMKGHWEFTSNGDSITGTGAMSANYQGQEMGFTMEWSGKRVGDCK